MSPFPPFPPFFLRREKNIISLPAAPLFREALVAWGIEQENAVSLFRPGEIVSFSWKGKVLSAASPADRSCCEEYCLDGKMDGGRER